MSNKISTVLFDLDGTFLDTAPDLATALNIVLKQHNRKTLPFEKIRSFSSTGTRGLLGLGFHIDENHPQYPQLRAQFLHAYHQHLFDETQLFPGMESVLDYLKTQNIPWGIVTNKPEHLARQLLDNLNLAKKCACVIGGDTLAKRKPDPEPLLHAAELLGRTAIECVYIGDAERDIEAARRANMTSIAALYGYIAGHEQPQTWDADHYIESPEQIISWIQNKIF